GFAAVIEGRFPALRAGPRDDIRQAARSGVGLALLGTGRTAGWVPRRRPPRVIPVSSDVAGREAFRAVVADDRRIGPAVVLHSVVSARTWLAVIHLIAGFFVGLATFILLLTGLATGIALLPFFLAGLFVLAGTFWLCIWMAN